MLPKALRTRFVRLLRRLVWRGAGMDTPEAAHWQLERYQEQIEDLRFENEQLRLSATSFGELAERLNQALRKSGGGGRTPIPGGR